MQKGEWWVCHLMMTLLILFRVKDLPSKGKGGGAVASASEKPSQPSDMAVY